MDSTQGRNIIKKAERYLEKLVGISFPKTPQWKEMEDYRKLRNCVVHNQGYLTPSNDDKYLRDTYIPHHPYLSIQPGIYGDEVVFRQGFCESVIDTIRMCFEQLHEVVY